MHTNATITCVQYTNIYMQTEVATLKEELRQMKELLTKMTTNKRKKVHNLTTIKMMTRIRIHYIINP